MKRAHELGNTNSALRILQSLSLAACLVLTLAAIALAQDAVPASPIPQVPGIRDTRSQISIESEKSTGPERSAKQKREMLKSNFEKMKDNAAELADEANALRQALEKSSADILSLNVLQRAEKIEKLAKKIKDGAKGY